MSVSDSGLAVTLTATLICGCVVCCSEAGAFGFSNERSLMYCAATASTGAVLGAAAAGPPLVVLTMNSPSNCDAFLRYARVWLTRHFVADKNRSLSMILSDLPSPAEAGFAKAGNPSPTFRDHALDAIAGIARKLAIGHLLPLARREIDGGAVARIAAADPDTEGLAAPAAHRANKQHSAGQNGEK